MVVAREHEHAAVLRGAREVGVLEHIAAAVDARALAVPHGEHAVDLRVGVEIDLLAAPDRGRCEIFVEPRLELNAGAVEKLLRLP